MYPTGILVINIHIWAWFNNANIHKLELLEMRLKFNGLKVHRIM